MGGTRVKTPHKIRVPIRFPQNRLSFVELLTTLSQLDSFNWLTSCYIRGILTSYRWQNSATLIRRFANSPWKFDVLFTVWRLLPSICKKKLYKFDHWTPLLISLNKFKFVQFSFTNFSQYNTFKNASKIASTHAQNGKPNVHWRYCKLSTHCSYRCLGSRESY